MSEQHATGRSSATESTALDADAVRAQVARILGDPSFVGAPQLSRLLQHLVANALTGERREVKEYSLGVELFDRGASFDPRADTVVRAAARRLRQRLEAYFDGPGRLDPIVIEIPKGHYLAVFRARTENGTSDEAASGRKRPPKAVIAAIVAMLALAGSGAWWFWIRAEPGVAATPSILVLPFQNLSDSTDTNYFASGVHDDLLTMLQRVKGLDVIARTTAVSLAAANKSVKEMAATVGVGHVLEGSIRRSEDRVRLTVQLIAAEDERHLWAETYDRRTADTFALQSELAQTIAEQLRIRLDPKVVAGFAKARTSSIEAYDLVLRASTPQTRSPAGHKIRVAYLERAIELDPNYADAYALLGTEGTWSWAMPEVTSNRTKNLEKALSIDPDNADALLMMAWLLPWQGRADLARTYIVRAAAAAPGDPMVQMVYGYLSADYRERLRHWEEAYRVDPLGGGDRALFIVPILLAQKRFAEALAAAQSLAAVAPETGDSSDTLASVYLSQDDTVAGLRQLRRTFEIEGNANRLIDTLSLMGQTDAAARWLDATKPGPRWAALIALRTGSTEALGDVVTPWLAASPRDPFPLGFYAFLLARRADEAFDRGDTAAQQVLLADAISAFRDVPFFDDRPGFHMDYFVSLQPRLRWLTVARQAGDEALATKLQSRLTKTMNEQFSPEEFSFERGLLAALAGDRSKAIDEFERAMVVGQWCLPGLEIFGVLQDRGGVFHGVAADPRFQQLVAGERARRIELNDRILAEAPDLLEPPKPSPNASVEAHGS